MSRVRTVIATEVIFLCGLLAFLAAGFLVDRAATLGAGIELGRVASWVFAALPALLWLAYFRTRDSQEFDPRPLVILSSLVGGFIVGPVAGELSASLLSSNAAASPAWNGLGAERLVMTFLVVALGEQLLLYLVLRYTFYPLDLISEPVDGIVYATALGLGLATFHNVQYFASPGGDVMLSVGAARVATTMLAYASFAAVLGLAMGAAKFHATSPARRAALLLAGVLAATVLQGLFVTIEGAITGAGLAFAPWRGVAFAFGFAALVLIAMSFPVQRLTQRVAR